MSFFTHLTIRSFLFSFLSMCFLFGAGLFILAPTTEAEAASNPFHKLAGSWRGVGYLSPNGTSRERVRCRVSYRVSGAHVSQSIKCAGTDYRINAHNSFSVHGTKVSGSWSETNYGYSGWASGRARGKSISLAIGGSMKGRINVYVPSRKSHSVTITRISPSGQAHRIASISLRR